MERKSRKIGVADKDQLIIDMALFDYHFERENNAEFDLVELHFVRDIDDKEYLKELNKLEKSFFFEDNPKIWPLIIMVVGAIILLTVLLVLSIALKPNFPLYLYFALGIPAILLMSVATLYSGWRIKKMRDNIEKPLEKRKEIISMVETLKKDFKR